MLYEVIRNHGGAKKHVPRYAIHTIFGSDYYWMYVCPPENSIVARAEHARGTRGHGQQNSTPRMQAFQVAVSHGRVVTSAQKLKAVKGMVARHRLTVVGQVGPSSICRGPGAEIVPSAERINAGQTLYNIYS